jgi:hypothetical protein
MTKTESHTVGEWLDKSQAKDLRRLRENELLAKFDDETLHMMYGWWCREKRECFWSSATPKNIAEFVKYLKREK